MSYTRSVFYDPTGVNIEITDFVQDLEFTDIGTGEIRNAILKLNSEKGSFITETTAPDGSSTPIMVQFDKIRVISNDGLFDFDTTYEVNIAKGQENVSSGDTLVLSLLGSEQHLQKTNFADQFYFESGFVAAEGVVESYNNPTSKGTLQADITGFDSDFAASGGNDLPVFTANDFPFNISEISHYDALLHIVDRMGASISNGGGGDFFELGFNTDSADPDTLNIRMFSSGNPPDQRAIPTLEVLDDVNPIDEEAGIFSILGNVTGTWGGKGEGTLPRQNSDFEGGLEYWGLLPIHTASAFYPEDAITRISNTVDTQGDEEHYKVNNVNGTTQTPPDTDWTQYFFTDFLTNEVVTAGQYSFWTNAQKNAWISNGAATDQAFQDPDEVVEFGVKSLWDFNQIIEDGVYSRIDVELKLAGTDVIPTEYKRNGDVFAGFRVLIDGAGTGIFAGFENQALQYDGTNYNIIKTYEDLQLCAVDAEALVYQFKDADPNDLTAWSIVTLYSKGNRVEESGVAYESLTNLNITNQPPNATHWLPLPAFQDVTTTVSQSNDCYHPVYSIENTQGMSQKLNGAGGTGATASVTITSGVIDTVTPVSVGSGYGQVVIFVTGGDGKNAIVEGNVVGGEVTSYTIINRGNDFTSEPTITVLDQSGNFGGFSAVTFEYRFTSADTNPVQIESFELVPRPNYYRIWIGANLRFPFPYNTYNSNTAVGALYGNSDNREPAVLDKFNMHFTAGGNVGFNNTEAEDLGQLDNFQFFLKNEWRYNQDGSGDIATIGAIPYRCVLVDTLNNMVYQDFELPTNFKWELISLPIDSFNNYRARAPFAWGNANQNIFLKTLEVRNKFRWNQIRKISVVWMGPYDDEGRYTPKVTDGDKMFPKDITRGLLTQVLNVKLSIDVVQFGKPLLSVSEPNATLSIQPAFFEAPLNSNKFQTANHSLLLAENCIVAFETV